MISENFLLSNKASLCYSDHGKEIFAVREASVTVDEGEFLGILGPSGSGKSSLLYLLSGLKTPSSGEIIYQNQILSQLSEPDRSALRLNNFGFVFQQPYLLGYLSVLENVLVTERSTADEAIEVLARLGLEHKLHRLPHELSGGERQRVCVARALIGKPKVIFADEPTASLDHKNGVSVVSLLNENRATGALVMVTHDPTMLQEADRIIKIEDGQVFEGK